MPATRQRHPHLVKLGDPPTIIGHECDVCGRRAFPPDPYGCEQCGAHADRLTRIDLGVTGSIRALATVHRHHNTRPETPFTVATIVLDSGITLKGLLDGDATEFSVGSRVEGIMVREDTDDDGTEIVDLRFRLARDDEMG